MEKRENDLNIRVTKSEYVYLKKCSESADFHFKNGRDNFSEYLRSLLLERSSYRNVTYLKQLRDLAYELRKIGTNVNQIARKINSGYVGSSNDLTELKQYLKQIEEAFEKLKEEGKDM